MSTTADPSEVIEHLDRVIIRFAGDSGDGMQLTGDRFTSASAMLGNDLVTLPEYPAEIRAPVGTVAGVSAFQVHISDHDITTHGDTPDVLIAMNPAALLSEVGKLEPGATVIINIDAFDERGLAKAGYDHDPLTAGDLKGFTVLEVPMTSLTRQACEPLGVKPRDAERSKNFFALGLISWMYTRPEQPTLDWIATKFASKTQVRDANAAAFKAGHAFGETAELIGDRYTVDPAPQPPGVYTSINGNTATAWGLVAASQLAKLPLFLGSYPITPASDILHELAKHKNFGVRTLQAEDEIAGVGAALGAAYGGHLGVTTTSGPGVALKSETIGLAISLELPLLIIDVQRGGPSTGLPTKTEQSDLLMAMYGRHGESPLPIVAAYSPAQCFHAVIEAVRIAVTYRTPVFLLTDGYLANGAEPWLVPDVASLPEIGVSFLTEPNATAADGTPVLRPYRARCRHARPSLDRPWHARPGASHRGYRERGRHRQHLLHAREPCRDDPPPGGQGGRYRQRHRPGRGDRRRRRCRSPRRRMGFHLGRHQRSRRSPPKRRATSRSGPRHPSQPVPGQPRRGRTSLPQGRRSGDEPRPAEPSPARRVPGRRPFRQQGPRSPVHRR